MRLNRPKESITCLAGGRSRGVVVELVPITTDGIGAGISPVRIKDDELGLVEDIEGLGAKLHCAFMPSFEFL